MQVRNSRSRDGRGLDMQSATKIDAQDITKRAAIEDINQHTDCLFHQTNSPKSIQEAHYSIHFEQATIHQYIPKDHRH
jgi:hypothetical protein